jgi:hypothetical protein
MLPEPRIGRVVIAVPGDYLLGMKRVRRFFVALLLAVSVTAAAAMVPSFGDLQAAPVDMAAHDCECPHGCPPDGSDCPDSQLCAVASGAGIVAAEPPASASIQGGGGHKVALAFIARDSLSRAPPFHPPKR